MDVIADLAAGDACQTVVAAIVGAAGLDSTLAAARAGKRLLLANKESLVLAGELLMAAARDGGACIVPIDSEHNAILQCLEGRDSGIGLTSHSRVESRDSAKQVEGVGRVVLTASGGPFRGRDRAQDRKSTRLN